MDKHLIDYLQSGEAWLLVGSGPSTDMGYPDWNTLAENVLNTLKSEYTSVDFSRADEAILNGDFPTVFQEAWNVVGGDIKHMVKLWSSARRSTHESCSHWKRKTVCEYCDHDRLYCENETDRNIPDT
jgi:hypothetical protein